VKSNPILEEIWRIKDQLAAEAGYDMDRFCDNLEKWMAEHPHNGPVVRNAEELRQLIAEKERQPAREPALREEPRRTPDKP
jgi:ferric-dicitrate binding protein FerR (iron transport regulator)